VERLSHKNHDGTEIRESGNAGLALEPFWAESFPVDEGAIGTFDVNFSAVFPDLSMLSSLSGD